jgi:hypothetical protein
MVDEFGKAYAVSLIWPIVSQRTQKAVAKGETNA